MANAFEHMMSGAQSARAAPSPRSRKRKCQASDTELEAQLTQSAANVHDMVTMLDKDHPAAESALTHPKISTRARQPTVQRKKRCRGAGIERDMFDRPGAITYERWEHMIVAMAFCGLDPKHNFMNAVIRMHDRKEIEFEDELMAVGIVWGEAYQTHNALTKPSLEFIQTLIKLAENKNPSEGVAIHKTLHKYMTMMLASHSFFASPAVLASRETKCAIDGKSCKATESMFLVKLKMYTPFGDDKMDYRFIRERNTRPVEFHVNSRYINVLFGTWYLFHQSFLVGKSCAAWVAMIKSLPRARRDDEFPGFDGASDAAVARMFVASTYGDCDAMRKTAIDLAQIIEKRFQEYKKQLKRCEAQ